MACTATPSIPPSLLNKSSCSSLHKTNTKSLTLFTKHKHPFFSLASSSSSSRPHLFTFHKLPCNPAVAAFKPIFKVGAASSSSSEGTSDDAAAQEVFNWPSVILPFLFPALGGLLFGYDIGATSGATISLLSPELSGTTWFNLTSIELGLVVSGSLYGALLGSEDESLEEIVNIIFK